MVAVDADWAAASLGPTDQTECLERIVFGDLEELLSVKVRQSGESRKCWLPQYFYPPEDLQII
jgi:hypothetical protein